MLVMRLEHTMTVLEYASRDGKTHNRASNACVNFFLGWVKSVSSFLLFFFLSELCRDFGFLGVILMALKLVNL